MTFEITNNWLQAPLTSEEKATLVAGTGVNLVLASGGLDSTTIMAVLHDQSSSTHALFVDYGQPAARAEESSVNSICTTFDIPLTKVIYRGHTISSGEVLGRNALLLHIALLEFPATNGVVFMGVHDGTGYVDCSPHFIDHMKRSFDIYSSGRITVEAPFITWSKSDIYSLAQSLNVPIATTYSCEAGNTPCRLCRSCLDCQRHYMSGIAS